MNPPRTFRRSLSTRVTSLAALLLFGAAVVLRAAAGDYGAGFAVVAALALAAAIGAVSAWGDRFTLDEEGVLLENAVLSALGARGGRLGPRRLAWRDVAQVQVHRPAHGPGAEAPRALFLVPVSGRRMALDAIEDFEEVRRRVERAMAAGRTAMAAGDDAGLSTPPADRPR